MDCFSKSPNILATGNVFEDVSKNNEPLEPFTNFRKPDQLIDYL